MLKPMQWLLIAVSFSYQFPLSACRPFGRRDAPQNEGMVIQPEVVGVDEENLFESPFILLVDLQKQRLLMQVWTLSLGMNPVGFNRFAEFIPASLS
jgi:hypothetical protein